MQQYHANSICEMLYKLRDAVSANDLHYALFMSREVYEKISELIHSKTDKSCILQCEIKGEDDGI